jgi:hypothetical protein
MTARCNDGSNCLNCLNPEVTDPVVNVVSFGLLGETKWSMKVRQIKEATINKVL